MADWLHRLGLPELADVALRELPDPVDVEQLENWGMWYGLSKDEPISNMGGQPLSPHRSAASSRLASWTA